MGKIGYWMQDSVGLPCFNYTGALPYKEYLEDGAPVKLPEDPWFLLGNYQLTLFTHVSGEYELITGQRSWGRVNQGEKKNSGKNNSVLKVGEKVYLLTGENSAASSPLACKRVFGCGFADYLYDLEQVSVEKKMSVKPSTTPYNGASAFLLEVTIKNHSSEALTFEYVEALGVNYKEIQYQTLPQEKQKVSYRNSVFMNQDENLIGIKIAAECDDPFLFPYRESMSRYEGFPPQAFMKSLSKEVRLTGSERELAAGYSFVLEAGAEKQIQMIIGYSFEYGVSVMSEICKELQNTEHNEGLCSAYASEWLKVIPGLETEKDEEKRRELRWHAYNLEAMATYSEYYGETKIPQGTIYDYDWGAHASARDNFQHAMPLIYYNQELARSVIRYMLKRTTPWGEIRLIEKGNGYADHERYFTSDQQLFFFLLISEYLRVTKDYDFLGEYVEPYPADGQKEMMVIDFVEKCFVFLRDTVGVGEHGLVRLLNSDWNDAVYYIEKVPYNTIFFTGESHMNSAMALSILQDLIPLLENAVNCEKLIDKAQKIKVLCEGMKYYRGMILDAFLKDMEGRRFPRRMYFDGKPYGDDNMFLEPQGYTLQINELSDDKKKVLYQEMQERVYKGEKLGAREQEDPEFEDEEFDYGSRENGGFWWALNGPVIVGVSGFDKDEANRLLDNMTMKHCAEVFPEYWSSWWSAADNLESSLIGGEGLPDQSMSYADMPVYCAHPHAWILYCYYRIMEE